MNNETIGRRDDGREVVLLFLGAHLARCWRSGRRWGRWRISRWAERLRTRTETTP